MKTMDSYLPELSLPEIICVLQQHKAQLQSRYGIRRLAVFGSCARGESKAGSDIDILVELGDKPLGMAYFALVREIAALFPVKTDAVSRAALKPGYFPRDTAPETVKARRMG